MTQGGAHAGAISVPRERRHTAGGFPKWLLLACLLILYYVPGQAATGGPLERFPAVKWIGLLLIPLAAAVLVARSIASRRRLGHDPLLLFILLFTLVALCSSWINGSGWFNTLATLDLYLRYPILFFALDSSRLTTSSYRPFILTFLFITLLQVPEVLFRYLLVGVRWDAASLSLGPWGTSWLGAFITYALCLLIARQRVFGLNLPQLALGVLLLVPALVGEIKALVLTVPLCGGVVLLWSGGFGTSFKRMPSRILILAVVLISSAALVLAWPSFWGTNDDLSKTIQATRDVLAGNASVYDESTLARIQWTLSGFVALRERGDLALGAGPGSSLAGSSTGTEGALTASGAAGGKTQLNAMLWDAGLFGLLTYLAMLVYVLARVSTRLRDPTQPWRRWIGFAAVGMWVYYALLGPGYDLVWRYDGPSLIFWVAAAAALSVGENVAVRSHVQPRPRPLGPHPGGDR